MNYINILQDSIDTSVKLKLFNNRNEAAFAHIFKSVLTKIPISLFKNIDNFNPNRLKKKAVKAYPLNDRPRGNKNFTDVIFYQKIIQDKKKISPIWLIKKNNSYILLDGAHRVVASFIENKKYIIAYIISI